MLIEHWTGFICRFGGSRFVRLMDEMPEELVKAVERASMLRRKIPVKRPLHV